MDFMRRRLLITPSKNRLKSGSVEQKRYDDTFVGSLSLKKIFLRKIFLYYLYDEKIKVYMG